MWPNKREGSGEQNYHQTQIPSDVEVVNGFALDYHVVIYFKLEDMIISKEKAHEKIIKRLEDMKIPLSNEISDLIVIMCIHREKQWSEYAKIHLKLAQEDGTKLLQGLRPIIIRLLEKFYRGKVSKSYDIIASSEILSMKITSNSITNQPWFMFYEEIVNEGFNRCYDFKISHVRKI